MILIKAVLKSRAWKIGLLGLWVEALFIFRRVTKTTIVKNIGTYLTAIRANDE